MVPAITTLGTDAMSIEDNKAAVRRFFECFNKADLAGLEACFTDQRWDADRELLTVSVDRWHIAFPDYCYHAADMVAEGDVVAVHTLITGTHEGLFHWFAYGPWPASGRQISLREAFFIRIRDGKIAEWTATWNPDHLRQQLGVPLLQTSGAT
jgi:ketosteroid isomerase-like protein